jgi:restriction endonuclease S subunit
MKLFKLGEICQITKGKTITRATAIEGLIPVIGGGLGPTYYHNQANFNPPVITISASGANAGFVNYWKCPIWASDCTTITELANSPASIEYIYKYLQSKQEFINTELRRGSAQPHVYSSDIANLDIYVPSPKEQLRVVLNLNGAFDELDSFENHLEMQRDYAKMLKQSLLANAFSSNKDA